MVRALDRRPTTVNLNQMNDTRWQFQIHRASKSSILPLDDTWLDTTSSSTW
jgi:hypothetical protein